MRLRNFLAVSFLGLVVGCGGEPAAPPKEAGVEAPSLDLDLGGGDAKPAAATEDKKDGPAPAPADAPPADKPSAEPAIGDAPKGS